MRDWTLAAIAVALMWPLDRMTAATMAWRWGVMRRPLRLRIFSASVASIVPSSIVGAQCSTCIGLQQHRRGAPRDRVGHDSILMPVVVTGGSGLVGRAAIRAFGERSPEVRAYV